MKFRFIVRTFVEARTPQEAIKLAKKTNPHEVYIDNEVWKSQDYALKQPKNRMGFSKRKV